MTARFRDAKRAGKAADAAMRRGAVVRMELGDPRHVRLPWALTVHDPKTVVSREHRGS